MKWHFSPKRPSDKARDPVVGEFFALDAIKNAGEALVREGIQNSLDARSAETAFVRIYLSGERGALPAERCDRWFETAWPHLEAPKNGLRPNAVTKAHPCRYLVFEDFGTTGLTGDPEQFEPDTASYNPFFYFFRAEGKTQKEGDDRGRWGIGKQVFPRSSKAQSFFGYTETDQGGMLMGGCVLKHHKIGDTWYKPDGLCGEAKLIDADTVTVPSSDAPLLAAFRDDFNLLRKPGEHGLSVVVPYLEDDADDQRTDGAFSRGTLILAVLGGYFIPILEGRLEVEIEDPSGSDRLTKESYRSILDNLLARLREKDPEAAQVKEARRLLAYLNVAESIAAGTARRFELKPCPTDRARWMEGMIEEGSAQAIRAALDAGEIVQVRATLTVRPKDGEPTQDSLTCYVQKNPQFSHKPCHIREDLIISNVECTRVNGFVCLVRIENGVLATLLGDAEGPAHTEWQASSRNFKDKYVYGGMTIAFVSQFPGELLKRVYSASKQLDRSLLEELFFDVGPDQSSGSTRVRSAAANGAGEGDSGDVPVLPPPRVVDYRIDEIHEGFVVRSNGQGAPPGTILKVRAAYETARGTALGSYDPNDFRFTDAPISVQYDGCRESLSEDNTITLETEKQEFSLKATGFDVNRDLYVRVDVMKGKNLAEPASDAGGSEGV